jgi:hypothetical protein
MKKYSQCHQCAPKEFKGVHDITGHHELDVVIEKSKNSSMKRKLEDFITHDEAYGPLTAYSGYRNYRGDS